MNDFRVGYARALLDINGLRTDAEDPLDYIEGYDFAMRYDAQVKCKPGNKPCGKTCIPMKEKCRIKGEGGGMGMAGKIAGGVAAAGALGAAGTYALNKGFRDKVNSTAKGVAKEAGRQAEYIKENPVGYAQLAGERAVEGVKEAASSAGKAASDAGKAVGRQAEYIKENPVGYAQLAGERAAEGVKGAANNVVSAGSKAARDVARKAKVAAGNIAAGGKENRDKARKARQGGIRRSKPSEASRIRNADELSRQPRTPSNTDSSKQKKKIANSKEVKARAAVYGQAGSDVSTPASDRKKGGYKSTRPN